MAHIEVGEKCLRYIKYIDGAMIDYSKRENITDILHILRKITSYSESITHAAKSMTAKHESKIQRKPAARINRAVSLSFGLGQNYVPSGKKINILSDIRLPTTINNHLCENQDDFSVGQHLGASEEVEYQQINSYDNVEKIETDSLIEEYLDEEDNQFDGIDGDMGVGDTPTTNELFVLENDQNSAQEQYDEKQYVMLAVQQITSSNVTTQVRYIQTTNSICTENGAYYPEATQSCANEYSDLVPAADSHHQRLLALAAIKQLENNNNSGPMNVPLTTKQPEEHTFEQSTPSSSIQSNDISQSADITQSGDITTTANFSMDIQAEVSVETTGVAASDCDDHNENDVGPMMEVEPEVSSRQKRQPKPMPHYKSYLDYLSTQAKMNEKRSKSISDSRKAAAKRAHSETSTSNEKNAEPGKVLMVSDKKQSPPTDAKRTNAKQKCQSTSSTTTISFAPPEKQPIKRTQRAISMAVDNKRSTKVATLKKAPRSRAISTDQHKIVDATDDQNSTTRNKKSCDRPKMQPQIVLEDVKKKFKANKVKTDEIAANDKNASTSMLEKAKAKRKSEQRKTVSGPRPKISKHDNDDSKEKSTLVKSAKQLLPNGEIQTKAMKKSFARRNTVSCARNENANVDDDDDVTYSNEIKNTDKKMYGKNSLYTTLCVYCNQKPTGNMMQHYVKNHPDREMPLSRMSPVMVAQLKEAQTEISTKGADNKFTAHCYFCEESSTRSKYCWQSHLITHTGETMFNCEQCFAQIKTRSKHDNLPCKQSVVNVFETKKDGSIVGFMCNACNYFQFSRGRILNHLKSEHGFLGPSESNHYKEYKLV